MSETATNRLSADEQKELLKHFKAMIAAKRFLKNKEICPYYLKDVVSDVLETVEEYNLLPT